MKEEKFFTADKVITKRKWEKKEASLCEKIVVPFLE